METRALKIRNRIQSKESYRLWFEFLRRAIEDPSIKIDQTTYKAWGDVKSYKFGVWWRDIGSKVINLDEQLSVSVVEVAPRTDKSSYLIRVPKTLTSTQAGNLVRKLLIERRHAPGALKLQLRIREGAEIRASTFRAYLHTYDAHKELVAKLGVKGATARRLLIAVRRFYLDRVKKYETHNRKVDNLPQPLFTGLNRKNFEHFDVLESATATAAVSRYLREARKIIANVAKGRFPD